MKYIVIKVMDEKNGLFLKCDKPGKDSLYIGIIADRYIGSDEYNAAKIRVDKNPVIRHRVGADGSTAYITLDRITRKLALQLLLGKILYFRVTTYDYHSAEAKIDLSGSAEAIRWVNQKCEAGML